MPVRQPCFKLAARYRVKELALWTQETGLTGFYFRVLEEGEVRDDDEVSLLERTAPAVSVAEANRVMHPDKHDVAGIERLLAVSSVWPESRFSNAPPVGRQLGHRAPAQRAG